MRNSNMSFNQHTTL